MIVSVSSRFSSSVILAVSEQRLEEIVADARAVSVVFLEKELSDLTVTDTRLPEDIAKDLDAICTRFTETVTAYLKEKGHHKVMASLEWSSLEEFEVFVDMKPEYQPLSVVAH